MALFSLFTSKSRGGVRNFTDISNEDLTTMLENKDDYQFIDVRTKKEYNKSHIPGFNKYVDYYKFGNDISYLVDYIALSDLDKTKPVVIMCNSGYRSIDASNKFYDQGFTQVYNLKSGIVGWTGKTE